MTTVDENAVAELFYTSGTSANPKGVMLSHDNIVSNIKGVWDILPVDHTKHILSIYLERYYSVAYLI